MCYKSSIEYIIPILIEHSRQIDVTNLWVEERWGEGFGIGTFIRSAMKGKILHYHRTSRYWITFHHWIYRLIFTLTLGTQDDTHSRELLAHDDDNGLRKIPVGSNCHSVSWWKKVYKRLNNTTIATTGMLRSRYWVDVMTDRIHFKIF